LSTNSINKTIHPDDDMMKYCESLDLGADSYFKSGKTHLGVFIESIKRHRPSLLQNKRVLDYGCGHGRITRYLHNAFSPSELSVADVWDDGVKFCAKEFNAKPIFISNDNKITSSKFDIIISYSVFSHLNPELFEIALTELSKKLDKNGLFLFTAKGEYIAKRKKISLKKGFHYISTQDLNETGGRLDPEKYSLIIVTPSFVEKILDKIGMRIIEHFQISEKISLQELYVIEHIK